MPKRNRQIIDPEDPALGNSISSVSTKIPQIAPSTVWVFTLNNYTDLEIQELIDHFDKKAKVAIIGKEGGGVGKTPHLQGFVEFKKKCRPATLSKRAHWEKAKGTAADSDKYCSKESDVIYRIGFPAPIKIIENLMDWQHQVLDLSREEPDDRKVYWFWEPIGNIGKTQFVKYMVVKYGALFCSGGKEADIMNLVFKSDMDATRLVIFDIPRCHKGNVNYGCLEAIKNGLVCNTKYETGVKVFNAPHVFCFANFPPQKMEHLSADRWVVKELIVDPQMEEL